MKIEETKATRTHRFQLRTADTDDLYMNTSVDEPDPQADLEFWQAFMTGDYGLFYLGERYDITQPDTEGYTTMYHMDSGGTRRATISINNGLEAEYLVACTENNKLVKWAKFDESNSPRQYAEDFVMRRT